MSVTDKFMTIFMTLFLAFYFFAFYIIVLKRDIHKTFLRTFYNAVCSIFEKADDNWYDEALLAYCFDQLNLNYEKLCQANPNNNYKSILDLLETIIYYYDSYSNNTFRNIFRKNKEFVIRNFIVEMCLYIKEINPFISLPRKEADLMQSITDAIENSNKSLGTISIKQLSQEIVIKEKMIVNKSKGCVKQSL